LSERTGDVGDAEPELLISRDFDAPRDLVFKTYTEAEHLARWWGPKGFTMLRCSVDLRPGGLFHYCMQSPDGQEMWGKLVYREIAAPERLAFVVSFSDAQGGTVRAPFSADWPLEVLSTLTFTEHDRKTTLTMRSVAVAPTEAERNAFAAGQESVRQGTALSLDQLAAYLADLQRT
jgi:uncharacterized protein YndB with AHSA1/START domain